MSKVEKVIRIIISILLALTLVFIFYNSYLDGTTSSEISSEFYQSIKPILDKILPTRYNNEAFIRKLAHFSEFGLLGLELSFICLLDKKIEYIYKVMFFGLLIALTDETIQKFVTRGSSVIDCWIDFSGVVVAILGYLILTMIIKQIMKIFKKETY